MDLPVNQKSRLSRENPRKSTRQVSSVSRDLGRVFAQAHENKLRDSFSFGELGYFLKIIFKRQLQVGGAAQLKARGGFPQH